MNATVKDEIALQRYKMATDSQCALSLCSNSHNTVTLSITAYLLFNAYNFYGSGGNLVDNIIEFSTVENDLSVKLDFVVEPSNPINPVIPDYPENTITTFEQYLLYYSWILLAYLSEKRNNFVKLSFLGGIKGDAQLKLTLAIPIQLDSWLLGDNYVNSTQRLVDSYTVPTEDSQSQEETDSNLRFSGINTIDQGGYYIATVGVIPKTGKLQKIAIDDILDGYGTFFSVAQAVLTFDAFETATEGYQWVISDDGSQDVTQGEELTFETTEAELDRTVYLYIFG